MWSGLLNKNFLKSFQRGSKTTVHISWQWSQYICPKYLYFKQLLIRSYLTLSGHEQRLLKHYLLLTRRFTLIWQKLFVSSRGFLKVLDSFFKILVWFMIFVYIFYQCSTFVWEYLSGFIFALSRFGKDSMRNE